MAGGTVEITNAVSASPAKATALAIQRVIHHRPGALLFELARHVPTNCQTPTTAIREKMMALAMMLR